MSFPSSYLSYAPTIFPRWAMIDWENGSITSRHRWASTERLLPQLQLATAAGTLTAATVTNGVLSIPSAGLRTIRLFANSPIDELMRLDSMSTGCTIKWTASRVYRDLAVAMTGNERMAQYGDQGSAVGQTGGWVWRINSASGGGSTINCITGAVHWPDPHGALADDLICGSTRNVTTTNGAYTSTTGHFFLFAVQKNANGSNHAAHLFVDDDAVVTDTDVNAFPLPGISTVGPGNDAASNGFALFSQSVNDGTAILKNSSVWPVHFGEAIDMAHLYWIIRKLKANAFANPYL